MRGSTRKIAATAANDSWKPGSSADRGIQARSTSAPTASACQRSRGRATIHASDASVPATAARTTDGCQPTASAYERTTRIASASPTSRPSPTMRAAITTPDRDDGDVLAGHCEQVLEAACLEGVPQLPVDARVLAEDDAREQAASLPRRSAGERRLHVRAQPVADATDPAPPADDAPAVVAAQHHVHAATRRASRARRSRSRAHAARPAARAARARRPEAARARAAARAARAPGCCVAAEPHAPRPACGRRTPSGCTGPVDDDARRRRPRRAAARGRSAPVRRSAASPTRAPASASATAASASLRRSRDTRAPATAIAPTAASTAAAAAPRSRPRCPRMPTTTRSAGQPVSSSRDAPVHDVRSRGGHGATSRRHQVRGAARSAPARSRDVVEVVDRA